LTALALENENLDFAVYIKLAYLNCKQKARLDPFGSQENHNLLIEQFHNLCLELKKQYLLKKELRYFLIVEGS